MTYDKIFINLLMAFCEALMVLFGPNDHQHGSWNQMRSPILVNNEQTLTVNSTLLLGFSNLPKNNKRTSWLFCGDKSSSAQAHIREQEVQIYRNFLK